MRKMLVFDFDGRVLSRFETELSLSGKMRSRKSRG
jgi:hypothetical protein